MQHVGLVLRNDERETGNLRGKGSNLYAARVLRAEVVGPCHFATTPVDLRLDLAQRLVGNDKEVARTAGGVENADTAEATAQVNRMRQLVACYLQRGAQLVEEQRLSAPFRMLGTLVQCMPSPPRAASPPRPGSSSQRCRG